MKTIKIYALFTLKIQNKNNLPFSVSTIKRYFGSWNKFLIKCNIPVFKTITKTCEITCATCLIKFVRKTSAVLKGDNFCSRNCYNNFVSVHHPQKDKPSIKNGGLTKIVFMEERNCIFEEWKIFECDIKSKRKYCSSICRGRVGGRLSSAIQGRRSKGEIYFSKLCEEKFGSILANEPIFDGWDADIIIPKLKLAILYNGIWHYKQLGKNHKLKQVQSRDKIKIKIIKKCGYEPYIIKDLGKYSPSFVETEFGILLNYLSNRKKNYTTNLIIENNLNIQELI